MSKYALYGKHTLVANTFGQITFDLNNKKDVYIKQIFYDFQITTIANIAADEINGFQITKKSETAMVPLSQHSCRYKKTFELVTAVGRLETAGHIEFDTPIKLEALDKFYVGVQAGEAGTFSIKVLISEVNVTH